VPITTEGLSNMPTNDLSAIRRLQGLMDILHLAGGESIPALLDAITAMLTETVGYAGVVINVYRPEWDDFEVATAAGSQEMRDALLGETYDREEFLRETLDERFGRRGAYYVPDGAFDWAITSGARYVPDLPARDDPEAWHPGDEFFVPCRNSDGDVLAVLSLSEPRSGRRPTDDEIDFVVTVANHAARALEHAQRTHEAARHRAVLEQLLAVSSMFAAEHRSIETILQSVCRGVQRALGFQKVTIELIDPATGFLVPRAAAGWPPGEEPHWEVSPRATAALMDPAHEVGGCFLLPQEIGRLVSPSEYGELRSSMNGRGPFAWNRHWLFVPLRDQEGALLGRIWADDPEDRLLPSRALLEALAVFANQATMAIVAAVQLEQLRTLAEQDPLTGLLNRRTFMRELEQEVERARRYDRSLALILCDLDHFKALNDTHGHPTGDEALRRLADVVTNGLRAGDSAFRIGGDEFALLLPEATEAEAEAAARRLTAAFRVAAEPAFADLGFTFGVATVPGDATDSESLIRRADSALYERKRARPARAAITLQGL
jgi:diguanylate cyclase (GGDEF)-like protein